MSTTKERTIIGASELICVESYDKVPAKIDTGADTSAIWASNIHIDEDDALCFSLFDEKSPHYDGKILRRTNYSIVLVRSTIGAEELRYRVHLSIKLGGRRIRSLVNLSDRSRNRFPVLIGRRLLKKKFLIDPDYEAVPIKKGKKE